MSETQGLEMHGTTILAVKRGGQVAMAGDGQVSMRSTILKAGARKVRKLGEGRAIGGFAGSAADGIALFDRLDDKLREQRSPLRRAAVELAKEWRTDRALRRLEAMLVVADAEKILLVGGNGDVLEPDSDEGGAALAVGSGGMYALAAARGLLRHSELSAGDIAQQSLRIAAELCVYTNAQLTLEVL